MREDPVEILQKIFTELALSKQIQNELLQLVELLYKDLESGIKINNKLQHEILELIRQETFGITSKYTALKEQQASLKQQLEALKNENDDLNTQLMVKNEEFKKVVAEKEQELHHHKKNLEKQKEEEIKQKENELQTVKQSHEKRLQQLYAEMEAAGAFSAMQLDKAESNHKKQLYEVNKKLKDSMDTCGILRSELFNAKEQCNEYKSKILELQQRVRHSSSAEASFRVQEKSCNDRSNDSVVTPENNGIKEKLLNTKLNDTGTSGKSNTSLYSKYEPLKVSYKNQLTPDGRLVIGKKPPIYRSSPKFLGETPKIVKNNIPPLMKVREEKNNKEKQPVKKRKLYNPDDWTYLSIDHGPLSQ